MAGLVTIMVMVSIFIVYGLSLGGVADIKNDIKTAEKYEYVNNKLERDDLSLTLQQSLIEHGDVKKADIKKLGALEDAISKFYDKNPLSKKPTCGDLAKHGISYTDCIEITKKKYEYFKTNNKDIDIATKNADSKKRITNMLEQNANMVTDGGTTLAVRKKEHIRLYENDELFRDDETIEALVESNELTSAIQRISIDKESTDKDKNNQILMVLDGYNSLSVSEKRELKAVITDLEKSGVPLSQEVRKKIGY